MKKNTRKSVKKTFTKKDFESNDGMLTYIWGPPMWHFLHTMSFNYPVNPTKQDKKKYKGFLNNLGKILPCKHCRQNFKKNLKAANYNDKIFNNRLKFSKFIYKLHNTVNVMLGKKKYETYNKIRDRYENFRSRCNLYEDIKKFKKIKKEKGCTNALYGFKSKCVINIVPLNKKCPTFKMSKKCKIKKLF